MSMSALWLAEIEAYNPMSGAVETLRFSNAEFITASGDTPASTAYDARILNAASLRRNLFSEGRTSGRSQVGYGQLVLANEDGALDYLIDYGFDGRILTILRGNVGDSYASLSAVPWLVATMLQPTLTSRLLTISLRDRLAELQVPLQSVKYAGSNVLPDGLEGVAQDLLGKPKPVCYGEVENVAAILVNTAKLIYQVNDGAVSSVDGVYDRGIELVAGLSTWTARSNQFATAGVAIRAIASNGTTTIAVGDGGRISSSADNGASWTTETSGVATVLRGVCWFSTAGLFVAVGDAGVLLTSPTGVTWTAQTSGFGATAINAVAYGNGRAVAVGAAGTLSSSTDGVTWATATSGFGANAINAVTYRDSAPGLWLAVGAADTGTRSSDGLTWTAGFVGIAGATGVFWGVAASPGYFVAVGNAESHYSSADGIAWTRRYYTPSGGQVVRGVTYGNSRFVSVTDASLVISSLNGALFTIERDFADAVDSLAVTMSNDVVIVGRENGTAYTSASTGTYSTEAELLSDALSPTPGTFKYYAAGGYFRIGGPAAGLITADVTQGATAADRTAAQVWKAILLRVGMSGADYSSADITALDSANSAVIGFWSAEEVQAADVLDSVASTVGASWGPDAAGVFRIEQFTAPTGSAVVALQQNDVVKLERTETRDEGGGLPVWKQVLRWGRNYSVQTTDLAAGVSSARRGELGKEWREVYAEDISVLAASPLSPQVIEESLFAYVADAQTEVDRRHEMRKVRQDAFTFRAALSDAMAAADLNDVIELAYNRYGLSVVGGDAGQLFRAIGLEPDPAANEIEVTVWRPDHNTGRNRITQADAYRVTSTGAYRVTRAA